MKTTPHSHKTRLFPWVKLHKGQGFFIPCLNLQEMTGAGLRAAVSQKITDAKAYPAIRTGLLGVWFYRPKARG